MLSNSERRQVYELERQLAAEDPAFVARMRVPRVRPEIPVLPVALALLWLVAPILMLVGGWPAVTAAVCVIGTFATGALLRRRNRRV
jgi:hypothetical protein